MKFLFYSSFLLLAFSCFPRKIEALEIQFNTLNISHQLSRTLTCDQTSRAGFMTNRLEVVKRQSPCSGDDQWDSKREALNISLAIDQLRVNSIQLGRTNKLPVQSGHSLGTGNYIVTIGFGTPVRKLSLIFDTGSDLTWIQCQPCLKQYCYQQEDPIFVPSHSSTYSKIPCNSHECHELKIAGYATCDSNQCAYSVQYGDSSYSQGYYSSDTLTITSTGGDGFPGFIFGCGQDNQGLFGKTDGFLGLGRIQLSFVSQTANKFHQKFSYCLPPSKSSTGFLAFGKHYNKDEVKKMVFASLVTIPQGAYPHYYIEITAISVGGTRLPIKEVVFTTAGAIIDSGTVITRLPPTAYKAMSTEFKRQMMKLKYKSALPLYGIFDTCFHISNTIMTKVPTVSFTFMGRNATIHLDPSGILVAVDSTRACLAFIGNTDPGDLAIFGNTQQRKFEVMYDVAGNQVGFLSNPSCL